MTLDDLIERFRIESGDNVLPYQWDDDYLTILFNEAVEEACSRKELLFDKTTAAICEIAVVADTATYALHDSIVHVDSAVLVDGDGNRTKLTTVDRDAMDHIDPDWRDGDGDTKYLIVDETSVEISGTPAEDATLKIEVYRVPVAAEKMPAVSSPVIASAHHRFLYHWPMSVVFLQDDADYFAPDVAGRHLQKFEDYFGKPPDADRKRRMRANQPHTNKLW